MVRTEIIAKIPIVMPDKERNVLSRLMTKALKANNTLSFRSLRNIRINEKSKVIH